MRSPRAPANVSSSALIRVGSLSAPGTPCGLGLTSTLAIADVRTLDNRERICARRSPRSAAGRLDYGGVANGVGFARVELTDPAPHALARLAELVLESRELAGAVTHERELAVDVPERLLEQLAAAVGVDIVSAQLRAHLRPRLLGAEHGLELLERQSKQVFEAHHLPQSLDIGIVIDAVGARHASRRAREQPDLLVVADRARRRAGEPRDVTDAQPVSQRRLGRAGGAGGSDPARAHQRTLAGASSRA